MLDIGNLGVVRLRAEGWRILANRVAGRAHALAFFTAFQLQDQLCAYVFTVLDALTWGFH